jgi:cobalt-zinc-cadmium efflux system membrane fusion protein
MAALALVAGAAGATWLLPGGTKESLTPREQPPAAKVNGERNVLRFPEGAPQLAMIRSELLPSSPVPVAEPLSARVAYDEDVTARIGVGISGRIVALKAAPGDPVRAGQVLAEIDSADFGTAHADLDKARADEERKRLVLARAQDLGAGDGVAAKEVEAAEADYAAARAETARAEQRLNNLNPHGLIVHGQRVGLTSPVGGVVAERTATPGLEVSPGLGTPLFVVTDVRHLWLMVDLPEKLMSRVKRGDNVAVESDAYPDERFAARIVQLGQVLDPNTRRVVARARLDNTSGKLLPEMFVRASVLQDSGSGVRVPNGAIVNRGVHAFVFVETAPGQFQRRRVMLLTRGSDSSYVGEGLKGGERVVTTGALLLDAELVAPAGDRP